MRKNSIKMLCAAALSVVLVATSSFSVSATGAEQGEALAAVAEATAASEAEAAPVAESEVAVASETTQTKLDAPANPQWGENYNVTFGAVEASEGHYDLEIYKDGEMYYHTSWSTGTGMGTITLNTSLHINESGTYKFRIRAAEAYDPETLEASDWVESAEVTYTRPEVVLGTTVARWSDSEPGKFYYDAVPGAGGYYFATYFTAEGDSNERSVGGSWHARAGREDEAGAEFSSKITSTMEQHGAGKYRVVIRALSGNLDKYANGVDGDYSAYYDTTKKSSEVSNAIENAMQNEDSSVALEAIKNDIPKDDLKIAMQTDDAVAGQMKELEDKYVEAQNIDVKEPAVSEEAAELVKADQIKMIGAGLNAAQDNKVQLAVGIPEKEEVIPKNHYANSVQLSIELKREDADGETSVHELAVPISITMPIPAGLDAGRLTILHYHEDGTYETVNLKNNGDGTVTFTVTSFSTFVFAETIPVDTDDEVEYSSDDNGSVDYVDWNDVKVDVDWNAANTKLDTAIMAGNGQNVDVLTGKEMKVSVDVLNKLAGKNATLALQHGRGIAISISGYENKQIKGALDLAVTNKSAIPEAAKNTVAAKSVFSKDLTIEEIAPLTASVNLHVSVLMSNAGKTAKLYSYDGKSGQMKLEGVFAVTEKGQAMFRVSHGGQYIVTVE